MCVDSSISGGLNSLAAVTLQDVVRHFWFPDMHEHRATIVSKCIAVGYGLFMMVLTYIASHLGGVLQAALGLFGMIGGPTLGLFILGMLFPWSNAKGAYAGFLSGLVTTMWLGIGAHVYKPYIPRAPVSTAGCDVINSTIWSTSTSAVYEATTTLPDPADAAGYLAFYRTSYMWYSLFAVLVTNTVGLAVSFATGPNKAKDIDPKLLSPFFDIFCCCLPSKLRTFLRCYVEYPEEDGDGSINDKGKDEIEIGELNGTARKSNSELTSIGQS
ncbi:Sodium-dependent multivitamin transporter [Lamellibrachia satsuma]|nr:Sodium-dependent multivitamin transporter [Lamellibrachia satsuma]